MISNLNFFLQNKIFWLIIGYTHITSGFKTSGFKTSGFKTSGTSGLQNVRFTKRQVFKTSGCKKTSINILYLWLVEIRRLCCSHVCRQSDGCVLFSSFEVFLSYITIMSKNDKYKYFLLYKYIKFKNWTFWNQTFWNLTFCKPDVLKPDVLKPNVLKPDVLWVYP